MLRRLSRGLFSGRTWYTRWLRRGVVAVCALSSLVAVSYTIRVGRATRDLDRAVAELDRTDPRWRIADILADLREIPDGQNSVKVIGRAHALLPPDWWSIGPSAPDAEDGPKPRTVLVPSKTLPGNVRLTFRDPSQEDESGLVSGAGSIPKYDSEWHPNDIQCRFPSDFPNNMMGDDPLGPILAGEIETVREAYRPAVERLRKGLPLERGRHTTGVVNGLPGPNYDSGGAAFKLAMVVWMEAYRDIHLGRPAEAAEDIRMLLGLARSFDGEPFLGGWTYRRIIAAWAADAAHRLVRLGSPREADLIEIERLLAREEAEIPRHLYDAVRGQRALEFHTVEQFRSGALYPDPASRWVGRYVRSKAVGDIAVGGVSCRRAQAGILRDFTRMLAALEKPFPEQAAGLAAIEADGPPSTADGLTGGSGTYASMNIPECAKNCRYQISYIRCCRACVLAEIHRIRFRRLPKSTEELCTSLRVPILMDPWTDAPLRWKAVEGEVRIYSLWQDGIDDGGRFQVLQSDPAGYDIGLSIPLSKAIRR